MKENGDILDKVLNLASFIHSLTQSLLSPPLCQGVERSTCINNNTASPGHLASGRDSKQIVRTMCYVIDHLINNLIILLRPSCSLK